MFSCRSIAGLVLIGALGCGQQNSPPYTDHSQDPKLYAQSMRRTVLSLLERAEGGDACTQIGKLATELSHTDRPRGSYHEIFTAMGVEADLAIKACGANNDEKSALKPHMEEIRRLAEKLPVTETQ